MPKRKTDEQFRKEVQDLVGEEYTFLESYTNSNTKTRCRHNKCGHEWNIRPNSFLNGTRCPRCAGNIQKTHKEFEKEVREMVGNEYTFLEEYQSAHEKIICRHNKCGHEWKITPSAFLRGRRCPKCYNSLKGEEKIENYLKKRNLDYMVEYFVENTNSNHLRFDFAVKKENRLFFLIEYYGLQHFKPVEYFGGKKSYKMRKIRDRKKTAYCKRNDIPLLRISYLQVENVENLIDNMVKKIDKEREEINA
jgi:uncharacterized protein with PIN domain